MKPRPLPAFCAASATMAANSGDDCDVPEVPSREMSGSERPVAWVTLSTSLCQVGAPYSCETPPPERGQRVSGDVRVPLEFWCSTVPPTAVTKEFTAGKLTTRLLHGELSFFTPVAPSSPLDAVTVMPASVAFLKCASRLCNCAELSKSSSGVPRLIEMTVAAWWSAR